MTKWAIFSRWRYEGQDSGRGWKRESDQLFDTLVSALAERDDLAKYDREQCGDKMLYAVEQVEVNPTEAAA